MKRLFLNFKFNCLILFLKFKSLFFHKNSTRYITYQYAIEVLRDKKNLYEMIYNFGKDPTKSWYEN